MKRLSKVGAAAARATERSYEAAGEEMTTRKAKFATLSEVEEEEEEEEEDEDDDDEEGEQEEDDEAGYGLRQNPRKTWRISSSKNALNHHQQQKQEQKQKKQELHQQQEKFICSKCGKGFQSSKAMCGHMACHSEKDKAPTNVAPKRKQLVMDSQSDTESGAKNPRRRSRRRRYKRHNSAAAAAATAATPAASAAADDDNDSSKAKKVDAVHHHHNNCSSGASGVEQQQEEVAICLMMLSRDSGNWGGLNSIGDSSDNNSVVLEARSISTKLAKKSDVNEGVMKRGSKKVKTLDNSESVYVGNRAGNVAADVKIKNPRKHKLEEESRAEPHLSLKKLKSVMDGEGPRQIERAKMEKNSAVNDPYNAEMQRRFEHKPIISPQAHKAFNQRSFTAGSPYESGENSLEADLSPDKRKGKDKLEHNAFDGGWKKGGKHECPICFKVFRSGQALGGHRRVHFAEGNEEIKHDEVAANFKPNGAQLHGFIDLNLPAPMEDEEEASESTANYGRFQARHQA